EWKKAEGDAVATGDVLAEVETDKAVMELVARADGTLLKRVVGEGDTVPVAEVVGWIGEAGEEIPGGGAAAPAGDAKPEAPTHEAPKAEAPKPEAPKAEAPQAAPTAAPARAEGERIKASPVARRIADE